MLSAENRLIRCAGAAALALLVGMLAGCGGGTSTSTTTICRDASVCVKQEVIQSTPTGSNTTEIVVDKGPPSFSTAVNVPYVTVQVCNPGSATCVTVDHVILDTGSYGLRLFKSALPGLTLPPVGIAADPTNGTPAGNLAECYQFVINNVWGPLVFADVQIGGERAPNLAMHVIDDVSLASSPVPDACGHLANSTAALQANGILGVGVVGLDCGITCESIAAQGLTPLYYTCPSNGAGCSPVAVPSAAQIQNPVTQFQTNSTDGTLNNNGTMIVMPAIPEFGAVTVRGRLVFGIGTQANNQLPAPPLPAPPPTLYQLNIDQKSPDYLYVSVQVGSRIYPKGYIDSGANAMFFDDATLAVCGQAQWYCPAATSHRPATLIDAVGASATFDLAVASADVLFSEAVAFSNLGGSFGSDPDSFALGLPFFYGRTVYTAIWLGSVAKNGPWYSF